VTISVRILYLVQFVSEDHLILFVTIFEQFANELVADRVAFEDS